MICLSEHFRVTSHHMAGSRLATQELRESQDTRFRIDSWTLRELALLAICPRESGLFSDFVLSTLQAGTMSGISRHSQDRAAELEKRLAQAATAKTDLAPRLTGHFVLPGLFYRVMFSHHTS